MFDTVNFKLMQAEANGVDFLSETSLFLDKVGEHLYAGKAMITGEINGLKVSLNEYQIKVKDGSLCKFYLGNNFKTMGRGDTQRAIEKLSDSLHLPMSKSTIQRMDIAQNFIMKSPIQTYLNHLGTLKNAVRLQEPNGLYYQKKEGRLCLYDKTKEQKNKYEDIPDLYKGRNVLRYEQRYTNRIASQLGVETVTGGMLYDEAFYAGLLKRWKGAYNAIQKINDISINFKAMETKQKFYRMGILALIEKTGGQLQMMEQIKEAQLTGKLTRKQAYDLRKAVIEATTAKEGLTVPNEAIQELDKKVGEAVKFYR